MTSSLVRTLRVACPLGASFCILATLVTCVVLVKVNHIWVSGLVWPYLSDMGRDAPPYYVFCTGLSLVAVLLVFTWTFNWRFHMSALPKGAKVFRVLAFVCFLAGVLANPGLPVLAFFDTSKHGDLHAAGARWFFYIEAVAVLLNTIVSYKLYKTLKVSLADLEGGSSPRADKLHKRKKTLVIQIIFFACFFVAFVIYMPVGTALAPQSMRLSIDDCIDEELGETYCTTTMRLNDTDTTLYDDRDTFTTSQMRAAAQLGCILTLVGYSTSFITNDYDEAESPIIPLAKV